MRTVDPTISGKFSYQGFRKGLYNIVYTPYDSDVQLVVARNLTFEEQKETCIKLNRVLEELREGFFEDTVEPVEENLDAQT